MFFSDCFLKCCPIQISISCAFASTYSQPWAGVLLGQAWGTEIRMDEELIVCMYTCAHVSVCLCMCVYFEWLGGVITFLATVLSGLYDLAFVLSTAVATVTEGSVSQREGSKKRWATLTLWLSPYDLIVRFEQLSSCCHCCECCFSKMEFSS